MAKRATSPTRQYARLVGEWIARTGLDALKFGTHSLRRFHEAEWHIRPKCPHTPAMATHRSSNALLPTERPHRDLETLARNRFDPKEVDLFAPPAAKQALSETYSIAAHCRHQFVAIGIVAKTRRHASPPYERV